MKRNITILETMRNAGEVSRLKRFCARYCKHAFGLGVICGVAGFLCICFSLDVIGSILSALCLLCFWADDASRQSR